MNQKIEALVFLLIPDSRSQLTGIRYQIKETRKKRGVMTIRVFEDLEVFQKAYRISLRVHRESLGFPGIEQYALGDQVRRAPGIAGEVELVHGGVPSGGVRLF